MSSDFTSRKLSWLEAVARDRTLPRSSIALAVLLACRYFNNAIEEAWPSERTLASDTGMMRANVRIGIERLVAAGLLRRRSGGPHTPSRYSIPRRWKAPLRLVHDTSAELAGDTTRGLVHDTAEVSSAKSRTRE